MNVIPYPKQWQEPVPTARPTRQTLAAMLTYIAKDIRDVGCPLAVNLTLAAATCLLEAPNDPPSEV